MSKYERMSKDEYGDTKEYEYTFIVPCAYEYRIVAESEEQARYILENGGIDIADEWHDCPDGNLLLEDEDYENATLHEELTEEMD
jgi:hypothetical protein